MTGYSPKEAQRETTLVPSQWNEYMVCIRGFAHLLSQVLQVSSDQVVAAGVEKDRETPRILECDQTGFSGEEIDVHDMKVCNALARHLRPINPSFLLRIEDCKQYQQNDVANAAPPLT
jgi:hypothetical protein